MKRPKYGAIKTEIDGITFASRAEARRYMDLKLLERAGKISNLQTQPKFPLIITGTKIGTYIADFSYIDLTQKGPQGQSGCTITEDVKSKPTRTPVYRLKMKLMAVLYPGVKITEVMG